MGFGVFWGGSKTADSGQRMAYNVLGIRELVEQRISEYVKRFDGPVRKWTRLNSLTSNGPGEVLFVGKLGF